MKKICWTLDESSEPGHLKHLWLSWPSPSWTDRYHSVSFCKQFSAEKIKMKTSKVFRKLKRKISLQGSLGSSWKWVVVCLNNVIKHRPNQRVKIPFRNEINLHNLCRLMGRSLYCNVQSKHWSLPIVIMKWWKIS